MAQERRIRITEGEAMEGGIHCPSCGSYTAFGDIIAMGSCRGSVSGDCDVELALHLTVRDT
ncbi:hypothetical protein ACFQE1_14685 [Halobium palmae]|uniref:Uncharacterized protein n=1 Tax=Halobium palmae TaxID=1776492 RepID=A0ABD5S203_9EURY